MASINTAPPTIKLPDAPISIDSILLIDESISSNLLKQNLRAVLQIHLLEHQLYK